MNNSLARSKPHYEILDGLRGVAALLVVAFHVFETHATSHADQLINHGYLAVDFFFLLSGFVIGYAYDAQWTTMSVTDFFKRRLIRLQPMVVMGMVIGAICFYFQDSVIWPGLSSVPIGKMLLIMLIGFTLLPVPLSLDIRGWTEMHPLNGPGWSLFYEYIANVLYALFVRKFSTTLLTILVVVSAAALIHLAVTSPQGDIVGGWSLTPKQMHVGFARVMFPFFGGLLLFRTTRLVQIKNAFLICSMLLVIVLCMPRVGGADRLWLNGMYDALIVILVFPLIVFIGASGKVENKVAARVCKFFGDISYPIYITHYPLIYIYTGWVANNKMKLQQAWPIGLLVFVSSISLAYVSLKFFDEPVRRWLKRVSY
ncbi:MAG: acyltransferase [Cyclobacteriaceae bacterium]|nr:acyltransferase [Cyclobacteriaceae bacterium]